MRFRQFLELRPRLGRVGAVALLALPLTCAKAKVGPDGRAPEPQASDRASEAAGVAELSSAPLPTAELATVAVEDDRDVLVIDGDRKSRRALVYLHGMCSDPREDLESWGGIAKEHGTIVALSGDVACPEKPGQRKWSENAGPIDGRIAAALAAVSARRGAPLDRDDVVLIGESMGAARAESLAATFPERYTRLVLIGSPQQPSPRRLTGVKAVANLAGEKEPQSNMRAGTRSLESAGYATHFWEIPEATHGQYGPDGERVMGEAVAFVLAAD